MAGKRGMGLRPHKKSDFSGWKSVDIIYHILEQINFAKRSRDMRKLVVLGMAAVLLGGSAAIWFVQPARKAEAPPVPLVPVEAARAETGDMPVYLRGIGTVQPYNLVVVKSRVDGHIRKVFFAEGQMVRAGDPLFEIDPRPFQAQLDQALAARERDGATLSGAQRNLDRYGKLVGRGFQTRQSYEDQKALVDQLQGAVRADEAQIEAARLNLGYSEIRAPIEGRTGARLVDRGNFIQASQSIPLVAITQTKPIYVSFTLPQNDLGPVREAAGKEGVTVLAFAGDDRSPLGEGKLTLIDNQVDAQTGTIHLKASFPNPEERLWPGGFVNVRLVVSVRKGIVTVPAKTVMEGPKGYYIYVIGADDKVEQRPVRVAGIEDGVAMVEDGLAAGERVVVEGQYRLAAGMKVKVAT